MEPAPCATLHVCRAEGQEQEERLPTLVPTGYTERVSDASKGGYSLCEWTACGRYMITFFLLSRLLQGPIRQHVKRLEICSCRSKSINPADTHRQGKRMSEPHLIQT